MYANAKIIFKQLIKLNILFRTKNYNSRYAHNFEKQGTRNERYLEGKAGSYNIFFFDTVESYLMKLKLFIYFLGIISVYQIGKWGYGEAAEAYFEYKCETEAGEFIYRTVENVEGLFQMRPRDPKDYFDRLRKGDIPEDPYGHTNVEAQQPWKLFVVQPGKKYHFFETTKSPNAVEEFDPRYPKAKLAEDIIITGEKYWRYELTDRPYNAGNYMIYRVAGQTSELKSKYGFTWKGIRSQWDKFFSVWGGETMIKELETDEVLATKKGFVLTNKYIGKGMICPEDKHDGFFMYDFISKVLKPM